MTFGAKNQSFRNKSGKSQPIRTKFGIHGHVKGWQRSGNFGRDRPILGKIGAGTNPAEREFFCVIDATFRQLRNGRFSPNLATKHNSVSLPSMNPERPFWKMFTLGVICPQSLKWKVGQTGTSLTAGYRSRDALQWYTVYSTVVVQGSFRGPVNFFVRRTVAELRGVKFSDFGLFSPYKTPKTYLPVTSLQPRG